MNLSWQTCSQARLSRDARFDGKFFIGVLTSKVYCRPICPARTAKEKNVRYFPTAAAAAEAGFRPCLRCRPECSPGTPAWMGTPATVTRALRLIGETGLDEGVEDLAQQLGVGARHLRRLFIQHLGASPIAVAHTRRLHFAKKLIDETRLPMSEVAMAAGFGCVRRFNAHIRRVYRRTPTQIRRLSPTRTLVEGKQYEFRLRYRPPFDWQAILAFLAPRAIPGVESVKDGVYRRTICVSGSGGLLEVACEPTHYTLAVRVQIDDPQRLFYVVERVRRMFDLNADWSSVAQVLKRDPDLAPSITKRPGLRVLGSWDTFELAVRAILGQQVTVKGATTLAGRMVEKYGTSCAPFEGLTSLFPTPATLASARFQNIGLTMSRAETIRSLARAVTENRICFGAAANAHTLSSKLCELPGIGEWTAQYIAMRGLGEPDAFPSSDLGLLRALRLKSPKQLESRAENWRPWRAYAAMYLWSA